MANCAAAGVARRGNFSDLEKERALDELERAYERADTNYLFLAKVDPLLDELRGDPRFEALVQKVIAPKDQQ